MINIIYIYYYTISFENNNKSNMIKNNNRYTNDFCTFWFYFWKLNYLKKNKNNFQNIYCTQIFSKKEAPCCVIFYHNKYRQRIPVEIHTHSNWTIFWHSNVIVYKFFSINMDIFVNVEFLISLNLEILYRYNQLISDYHEYKSVYQKTVGPILKLFFTFHVCCKMAKETIFDCLIFFKKKFTTGNFLFWVSPDICAKRCLQFIFTNLNHFLHSFKKNDNRLLYFLFFFIDYGKKLIGKLPLCESFVKLIYISIKISFFFHNYSEVYLKLYSRYKHTSEFGMNFRKN